jgi:hypothetical protein
MSHAVEQPSVCPQGLDFLKLVSQQEDACESETRRRIPKMGKLAPPCFRELGTVLSLLDRAAACFWGCRRGDHVIEYLAGRVCTSSRAALRLLLMGFYDESLSLTRNVGEIANLLLLFNQDASALPQWLVSSKQLRMKEFGPAAVRKRLEVIGRDKSVDLQLLYVNQERYGSLCELATHPTPQTKPQAHNALGIPFSAGEFQEAGLLVSLNELAEAVSRAVIPLPKLLGYDNQRRSEIQERASILLSSVGKLSVENQQEMYAEIWQQHEINS